MHTLGFCNFFGDRSAMTKNVKIQRRMPKQARAVRKYNEILDTSARVLLSLGYQQATMQEISLESGHPYATIYQYFANKEAIYEAWLERFINESLYGLSAIIQAQSTVDIDRYIDESVRHALTVTARHQPVLDQLFRNMPMTPTRLVELMEQRTWLWLSDAFGLDLVNDIYSATHRKILTAVRAGNGYWLQLTLNAPKAMNLDEEVVQFATLVKAIMKSL